MSAPAGIGENLCHPESTIALEWLLDRHISTTRSIIDAYNVAMWERVYETLALRSAHGITAHLVWNSEGSGLPAWPEPHSMAMSLYVQRWMQFMDGAPVGSVASATAGNEGDTLGWVTTDGNPITVDVMARTAERFARACAPHGVQPWATSLLSGPDRPIIRELSRAISGLCYGVPVHPYYRSIGGAPWPDWYFGTVEDLADYCGDVFPDDVACIFDELGCPTVYDGIGESGQAAFCAAVVGFQHPKIDRLWYFTGPEQAVPQAEIDQGKDWWIIGRPLAEAAFRNALGGSGDMDYTPWIGAIGPGIIEMMRQDQTLPAQRSSTWLPLGIHPSDVEEAYGQNGTRYVWLLTTGKGFRFVPAQ